MGDKTLAPGQSIRHGSAMKEDASRIGLSCEQSRYVTIDI